MYWLRFVRAGLGFGSSKRAYMTVKYSDGRPDEVRRLSVSETAEVTIQIEERDGQQFIVIREQPATDRALPKPCFSKQRRDSGRIVAGTQARRHGARTEYRR